MSEPAVAPPGPDSGIPPLDEAGFARLMAPFAPFEPAPRIAVAVSGGADSLALALLIQRWAKRRGGEAVALTVDHRLRPGSGAEAKRVGALLASEGMAHRVLRWPGPRPAANLQAAARAARYRLLAAWCRRQGILHLALAHQRDDQAETLLLRLARGSGLDGLSAMAPTVETPDLRLIRPLLPVPKARLETYLRGRGLAWIEDPSNQDAGFARVRMRRLMPALAREGADGVRLAAAARHLARARTAIGADVARLAAAAVALHPAGFARLDPTRLTAAPPETALRTLARVLMAVGGAVYTPRLERLERLYDRLCAGLERGATLGGCRLLPRRDHLLVTREAASIAAVELAPGDSLLWDGRFEVSLARRSGGRALGLAALGPAGWAEALAAAPALRASPIPGPARLVCPAFRDRQGLLAAPQIGYWRDDSARRAIKCRFAPLTTLAPPGFTVA